MKYGLQILVLVFTMSGAVFAEGHLNGDGFGGRSVQDPTSGLLFQNGACTVVRPTRSSISPLPGSAVPVREPGACFSAACCPEDVVAAVCLPTRPDCSRRVCQAPKSPCPETCADTTVGKEGPLFCKFTATFDDMLSTRTQIAANECVAKQVACTHFRKLGMGDPDSIEDRACVPLSAPRTACDLVPGSQDPNCSGTLGGPVTYFFDKVKNSCNVYPNLGSCDAKGPFASSALCEAAVAAGTCR